MQLADLPAEVELVYSPYPQPVLWSPRKAMFVWYEKGWGRPGNETTIDPLLPALFCLINFDWSFAHVQQVGDSGALQAVWTQEIFCGFYFRGSRR